MRLLMRITDHDQGFCIQIQEQGKVIVDEVFVSNKYLLVKTKFLHMVNSIREGKEFRLVDLIHSHTHTLAIFEPIKFIHAKRA